MVLNSERMIGSSHYTDKILLRLTSLYDAAMSQKKTCAGGRGAPAHRTTGLLDVIHVRFGAGVLKQALVFLSFKELAHIAIRIVQIAPIPCTTRA